MEQIGDLLVVSAHAADYVWRSGGTIAKYIEAGARVKVIVLSFGVRGESGDLWKTPGQTAGKVKEVRQAETRAAAAILGVEDLEFWDLQDYPMPLETAQEERLVEVIRAFRPAVILTHDRRDILNPDHNAVHEFTFRCSVMANSAGVENGLPPTRQMKLLGFEPHQTELSGFVPGCFIDITQTYDKKIRAMQCFKAQNHLIEYYTQRAFMRGNHARRLSGNQSYQYAESFAPVFPYVGDFFFL